MELSLTGAVPAARPDQGDALLRKAKELEAGFLAEMLAHGGLGENPDGFGGGIGEDHFASFLRAEQARLMVDRGGIGLAEVLFRAMSEVRDAKV
jgi:Rod binding domain-containing protein